MMQRKGKVWLVGAGPGDSGLLTLKGKQVLEQADSVLYDSLLGEGILSWIPPTANRIHVGKRAGNHAMPQEEINHLLLQEALAGKRVVRLKGGDPFLFGRGGEELELLQKHGIPFEIVPGVPSAIAVPAYAGIPVTHRAFSSSLHIITGHKKSSADRTLDYTALAKLQGTLVFLMGVSMLNEICQGLLLAGMAADTPAALIENGTTARQRQILSCLEQLPEEAKKSEIQAPAILIIGKVCGLANQFSWTKEPRSRPLGGVRVLVTRPKDRASALSLPLMEYGAEVVELPAIQTIPIQDNAKLEEALHSIKHYGWIAFTSVVGVDCFFSALRTQRVDVRSLSHLRFAAIGSATQKAIEDKGILVEYTPDTYDAETLAKGLASRILKGEQLLLPRAKEGTPSLNRILEEAGVPFDDIPVYETLLPAREAIPLQKGDLVAFTSASTVRGFVKIMGNVDFSHLFAVCIGEQTAQEARRHGMSVHLSKQATIPSMVDAILALAQNRKEARS